MQKKILFYLSNFLFFIGCFGQKYNTEIFLKELNTLLQGSFENFEQAQKDTEVLAISLHIVPIWKEKTENYWLYAEQSLANKPARPYLQRIFQLKSVGDSQIFCTIYNFKNASSNLVGEWKKSNPCEQIHLDDLVLQEGCNIIFKTPKKNKFDGFTNHTDCANNLRGATFSTTEVHVKKSGLEFWERGFSENGKQVWGNTHAPIIFKRMK